MKIFLFALYIMGENKKKLLLLQKEGKYVFHGSPDIIKTLGSRLVDKHLLFEYTRL